MSKPIKIRRLIIRGDRGVEAPGERDDVVMGAETVFSRFPHHPGREPKSTPYNISYDGATGLITVEHPRSGTRVTVPREHCYWVPFSAADEKREAEELEKATRPEARASA